MKKVIILITLVIIVSGCLGTGSAGTSSQVTEDLQVRGVVSEPAGETGMNDTGTDMNETEAAGGYEGEVLAGDSSKVLVFNSADYNQAVTSDKLVVLYFYANWCPICRDEVPKMYAAFDELERDDVVGFRVNYNDDETDDDERALAREFGVGYQHTKVLLKDGERVLKSPETWEKDRYLAEISTYAG